MVTYYLLSVKSFYSKKQRPCLGLCYHVFLYRKTSCGKIFCSVVLLSYSLLAVPKNEILTSVGKKIAILCSTFIPTNWNLSVCQIERRYQIMAFVFVAIPESCFSFLIDVFLDFIKSISF